MVMSRVSARIDYGPLPVVHRDHFAAPSLGDEQGREALRFGRALQDSAATLGPEHARAHAGALRRKHVIRLSLLVFVLEIEAGIAVIGQPLGWWPT